MVYVRLAALFLIPGKRSIAGEELSDHVLIAHSPAEGLAVLHLVQTGGQSLCQVDIEYSKLAVFPAPNPRAVDFLLIATAVVAVMLALHKLDLLATTLIVLFMLAVFGATAYFHWQDKP